MSNIGFRAAARGGVRLCVSMHIVRMARDGVSLCLILGISLSMGIISVLCGKCGRYHGLQGSPA